MNESIPGSEGKESLEALERAVNDFIEQNKDLVGSLLEAESLIDLAQEFYKHTDLVERFFQDRQIKRGEGRRALQNALELLWSKKGSESPDSKYLH